MNSLTLVSYLWLRANLPRTNKGTTALAHLSLVEAAKPLSPASADVPLKTGSLLETILAALDDAKAEDISALDLEGRSSLADHMVVATGRSDRHVGAVADRVARALKDNGFPTPRIEGLGTCEWVLIDAGDIIVHVFKPEARSFYNLERLWGADRPAEQKQGRADSARP